MPTQLFHAAIFGPVNSRRFGISLGINLLAPDQKVCNFDCVYCECGFTENPGKIPNKFADAESLLTELEERFAAQRYPHLDVITYAGNGEPTLHPHFGEIASGIRRLRDIYYPHSDIVLLTNGTTLHKAQVRRAAAEMDIIAVKLDAGSDQLIAEIDRPGSPYSLKKVIHWIKELGKPVKIQTMFLKGMVNGNVFDNSQDEYLKPWIECLREIRPLEVMLYSIDRETPLASLEPVSRHRLEHVGALLQQENIPYSIA